MIDFVPIILRRLTVCLLFQFPMLVFASEETTACLERIAPLNKHQEVFDGPKPVMLSGSVKAEVVFFREAHWEFNPGQLITGAHTNGIYNHTQLWFVRLADNPNADGRLKSSLHPASLTNEYYCELAYLGKAGGCAWFGYMPIYEWTRLQSLLGLQEGDDPFAAALRGLVIEDRGSMTANSVVSVFTRAGAKAIPYLKPMIASTNPANALRILSLIPDHEVTELLIEYVRSTNQIIASHARHWMEAYPRADAEDLYFEWLENDAGKAPVLTLLRACVKLNKSRVKPMLQRILAAPRSVYELRAAFELSRSLAGVEMPTKLLLAEETIKRYGYRSRAEFDQQKVDAAASELIHAGDVDAAACIGLSLALATTKGDWSAANQAGIAILKGLPSQSGVKMSRILYDVCDDESVKQKLKEILSN